MAETTFITADWMFDSMAGEFKKDPVVRVEDVLAAYDKARPE